MPIKAKIEAVARHTLNMPLEEIARGLKSGSLRLNGKSVKAGETVSVKAGDQITCGQSTLYVVEAHLKSLRLFLEGGPEFKLRRPR